MVVRYNKGNNDDKQKHTIFCISEMSERKRVRKRPRTRKYDATIDTFCHCCIWNKRAIERVSMAIYICVCVRVCAFFSLNINSNQHISKQYKSNYDKNHRNSVPTVWLRLRPRNWMRLLWVAFIVCKQIISMSEEALLPCG